MTMPLRNAQQATVPAAAAATVQDQVVGEAPFLGTITEVTFAPEANIVGRATDFRTYRLINRGLTGAGTTVVASLAFNAATVTATAFDERVIPLVGNNAVAEGDVLVWDEVVAGVGLVSPGGQVQVTYSRGDVSV